MSSRAHPTRFLRVSPLGWAAAGVLLLVVLAGVLLAGRVVCWRYTSTFLVQTVARPSAQSSVQSDGFTAQAPQQQLLHSDDVLAAALLKAGENDAASGGSSSRPAWRDAQAIQVFSATHARDIESLRRQVSVSREGDLALRVQVTLSEDRPGKAGEDPRELAARRAQQLANCLLDALLARQEAPKPDHPQAKTISAVEVAQQEYDKVRAEMESLLKRQTQADAFAVAAILSTQPAKDDLADQQRQVDAKLAALAALQQEVEKELAHPVEEAIIVSPELVAFQPALGNVLTAVAQGRLKVNAGTAHFSDEKELQATQDELQLNLSELRAEMWRCGESLRQQIELLSGRQRQLAETHKQQQAKAAALADQAAKYQVLRERLAVAQAAVDNARSQPATVGTPEAGASSVPPREVTVIEPPTPCVADEPAWPNLRWLALIGLLAGLPVAAGTLLWLRHNSLCQ